MCQKQICLVFISLAAFYSQDQLLEGFQVIDIMMIISNLFQGQLSMNKHEREYKGISCFDARFEFLSRTNSLILGLKYLCLMRLIVKFIQEFYRPLKVSVPLQIYNSTILIINSLHLRWTNDDPMKLEKDFLDLIDFRILKVRLFTTILLIELYLC